MLKKKNGSKNWSQRWSGIMYPYQNSDKLFSLFKFLKKFLSYKFRNCKSVNEINRNWSYKIITNYYRDYKDPNKE